MFGFTLVVVAGDPSYFKNNQWAWLTVAFWCLRPGLVASWLRSKPQTVPKSQHSRSPCCPPETPIAYKRQTEAMLEPTEFYQPSLQFGVILEQFFKKNVIPLLLFQLVISRFSTDFG
jgi:hypothetical protein